MKELWKALALGTLLFAAQVSFGQSGNVLDQLRREARRSIVIASAPVALLGGAVVVFKLQKRKRRKRMKEMMLHGIRSVPKKKRDRKWEYLGKLPSY